MDTSPIIISMKTAIVAIVFTFILGLFAARWILYRKSEAAKIFWDGIFTMPLVLPPTVAGFFLLVFFGSYGPVGKLFEDYLGIRIAFSWGATILAAVVMSFPLMYRSARGALEQIDDDLIFAARTLGMSEWCIFFKVMIPNALPGIISGGVLAFARGLGEFGATAMIAGNIPGRTRTLPLAVYSEVAAGNMDAAYQYVLVIVVICFAIVAAMNIYLIMEKKSRKPKERFMSLEVKIKKKLKEFTLESELHVETGCTGLMGPSGSGKSITLKCIAGVQTADSGRIILDGRVLYDSEKKINLSPQKRKIGYLFQGYALFPNMTIEENIKTGLKAKKLPKDEIEQKTNDMMKRFHIEELAKRYPRQISGGQKQRTALARMLVCEPEVILMDEPFSALDEYLREQMQDELSNMLEILDKPAILVSHSSKEVENLCDKKYHIQRGHMEEVTL